MSKSQQKIINRIRLQEICDEMVNFVKFNKDKSDYDNLSLSLILLKAMDIKNKCVDSIDDTELLHLIKDFLIYFGLNINLKLEEARFKFQLFNNLIEI